MMLESLNNKKTGVFRVFKNFGSFRRTKLQFQSLDLHISYVTICYNTYTMIHEDSKCGIHKSEQIFLGIEKFLRDLIIWRQDRNLPLGSGLSMTTTWTRIEASTTTTAQQGDGVSCGILTCGNATCRVHGLPGFP